MKSQRSTKQYCSSACRKRAARHPEEIKLCSLPQRRRDQNRLESSGERFYITRWGTQSKMDVSQIGQPKH
ncbi:MAG: hypothetical protein GVY17_07675 [Cyanobacteria bacterium]|nr:hypothetical protein [Cyanobacteria bacterium GSL.Bin21]